MDGGDSKVKCEGDHGDEEDGDLCKRYGVDDLNEQFRLKK